MSKNVYKKGISFKVSENFKSTEFDCKGSGCCTSTTVDDGLIRFLQEIRTHFNKKVFINSSYRCAFHNKAVGGASKSKHLYGEAADIRVEDTDPIEVARYAESIGVQGIGLYDTFCHIDTRTKKFYWKTSDEISVETFIETNKQNQISFVLKKGDKNESVKSVQILLKGKGFKDEKGRALSVDRIFGANTEYAVKTVQKKKGMPQTGIVDHEFLKKLIMEE